jgi:hypothetical protein
VVKIWGSVWAYFSVCGMWSFSVLSRAEMVVYYQSADIYERALAIANLQTPSLTPVRLI